MNRFSLIKHIIGLFLYVGIVVYATLNIGTLIEWLAVTF